MAAALQKLIGSYPADLARGMDVEVIYTLLDHTVKPAKYSFYQNTVLTSHDQKLMLSYFWFVQFYVSQATLAQWSLMLLMHMFRLQ